MNVFTFTGNLGNDCEVQYTAGGTAICKFSVAVKSGYGDRQKTNWVRCSLFGKQAESKLTEYLVKGAQVAVSGELELQEWEGQNGKGAALSVNVSSISLVGGRQDNAPAPQQRQQQQQGGYAPAPQQRQAQQQGYAPAPQQRQPQQQGGYAPAMQPAQDFDDDISF